MRWLLDGQVSPQVAGVADKLCGKRRCQPTVGSSRRRGGRVEGIFGRDLELAAMERFLDGAPTWPSAVVIEGEAGIGKTTLWLEGVRRAEDLGVRVFQARPAENEQKLSYVALAD